MNKKDLKTGMVVKYRDGRKRMVLLGTRFGDIFVSDVDAGSNFFTQLNNYKIDLTSDSDSDMDIVAVYHPAAENMIMTLKVGDLVWKRKEPKKLTLEQIESRLGYEVELVNEI